MEPLSEPAQPQWTRIGIPILMLVCVMGVYAPFGAPPDEWLFGIDFNNLHIHRIRFAQDALARGELPAWYPRELLGTPFWSNTQNFPFIPTRLVLLPFKAEAAFAIGVMLNACCAALFTYLFARRIGLGRVASAVAGWTFAASGEFASRVLAGHLVSLEGYPSLPLLLWLVELALVPREEATEQRRRIDWRLIALGVAACCVALTPHPQFPFYSFVVATVYVVYRAHREIRRGLRVFAAMALGGGMAAFALVPMFLLIRRSTRVLDLAAPTNDVPFEYHRLLAFVAPWAQGWVNGINRKPVVPFTAGPNSAYFWDTVCYTGVLPVLCLVAIIIIMIIRRRMFGAVGFVIVAGVVALVTAMPFVVDVLDKVPGTLLRSPARQVYVTVFALSVAAGFVAHVSVRWYLQAPERRTWAVVLVVVAGLLHIIDVTRHARAFVVTNRYFDDERFAERTERAVGDGRIAMDYSLPFRFNRRFDDVGFFDSIMLARTYRGLMALDGQDPRLNIQDLYGVDLAGRTLQALGVRLVVSGHPREDLENISGDDRLYVYRVPGAAPRADFFTAGSVARLPTEDIYKRLRDPAYDPRRSMMLPLTAHDAVVLATQPTASERPVKVEYERPGPDSIHVRVQSDQPGFVRVLESFDPGWSATVDGLQVEVLPADTMFLGVPVDAGEHVVRLRFATPGAVAGAIVSLICAAGLIGLSYFSRNRR